MITRTQVVIKTQLIDDKIELKLIEKRRLVPYDFRFSSPYADLETCSMEPFLKEHFFGVAEDEIRKKLQIHTYKNSEHTETTYVLPNNFEDILNLIAAINSFIKNPHVDRTVIVDHHPVFPESHDDLVSFILCALIKHKCAGYGATFEKLEHLIEFSPSPYEKAISVEDRYRRIFAIEINDLFLPTSLEKKNQIIKSLQEKIDVDTFKQTLRNIEGLAKYKLFHQFLLKKSYAAGSVYIESKLWDPIRDGNFELSEPFITFELAEATKDRAGAGSLVEDVFRGLALDFKRSNGVYVFDNKSSQTLMEFGLHINSRIKPLNLSSHKFFSTPSAENQPVENPRVTY